MNITIYNGSKVKEEMYSGNVDFDSGADTFRAMLMRSGFSFSATRHLYLKNIKANTGGAINYRTAPTQLTIARETGSWITDGFVVGNYITSTSPTNPGPYRITSVAALNLRVALVDDSTLSAEGTSAPTYVSYAWVASDEVTNVTETATVTAAAADQTLTLSGGDAGKDWYDDYGIKVGDVFSTNDGTNPGPFQVTAKDGDEITVAAIGPGTADLVDDGPSAYALTNGYTEANSPDATSVIVVAAAADQSLTLSGDDAAKDWDVNFDVKIGDVFSTNSGTNPGPYRVMTSAGNKITVLPVGEAALVQNQTEATYILSALGAGDVEVTFTPDGDLVALDSFDLSDFGVARWGSPGAIIYDDTNANKVIVCFIQFSEWNTSF